MKFSSNNSTAENSLNKKRNCVSNLNFYLIKTLVGSMSAILIIFCNCNEILTYRTKNLQTLILKRKNFSYISKCFMCNRNHWNTKSSLRSITNEILNCSCKKVNNFG